MTVDSSLIRSSCPECRLRMFLRKTGDEVDVSDDIVFFCENNIITLGINEKMILHVENFSWQIFCLVKNHNEKQSVV